jgi:hypothetical protein
MDTMGICMCPSGPVTVCMGIGVAHDMVMVSKPSMARLGGGSGGELGGVRPAHARNGAVFAARWAWRRASGVQRGAWAAGGRGRVQCSAGCDATGHDGRTADEETLEQPLSAQSAATLGEETRARTRTVGPAERPVAQAGNTGTAAVRRAARDGFDHMQSPGQGAREH